MTNSERISIQCSEAMAYGMREALETPSRSESPQEGKKPTAAVWHIVQIN